MPDVTVTPVKISTTTQYTTNVAATKNCSNLEIETEVNLSLMARICKSVSVIGSFVLFNDATFNKNISVNIQTSHANTGSVSVIKRIVQIFATHLTRNFCWMKRRIIKHFEIK